MPPTRRTFLSLTLGSVAVAAPGWPIWAETPIELEWTDLIPGEPGIAMEMLQELGVVQHGQLSTPFDQEAGAELTTEYDGKLVRIPGYLVPLDFEGNGMTAALLVPYIGACIHVPPPPANQLIFVTTADPYESEGLFEPVFVTGMFGAAATETQLAQVGYAISADRIEPYG